MNKLLSRLASVRLTLWLLLALAVGAALGTFDVIPQGYLKTQYAERFGLFGDLITLLGLDRFHTSLPFRGLLLLLILNLLACGVGKSLEGLKNALRIGSPSAEIPFPDRALAAEKLRSLGYRVNESPEGFTAARNPWAFAAFGLVHLSPVFIVVGAFLGSQLGFVGTVNISVGAIESRVTEWTRMTEIDLPFAIQPKSMTREWYPLRLRLMLKTSDGTEIGPVETMEGERFAVENTGVQVVVDKFYPDAQDISFRVFSGGGESGPYARKDMGRSPVRISPLAFKGEVRQVVSELAFFDKSGNEIDRKSVSVNDPAVVSGYRVFITAWGADDGGKPYVGLQVARDPGQWLLWSGSVILTLGVTLILFAEGSWVRWRNGRLTGRSSRNRAAFSKLLASLSGDPP